jgi:hypothetical protein
MANMSNSKRESIYTQHILQYIIQMVSLEICRIRWFEKINSHVVIPNFNIETQSTYASMLV